MTSRIYVCTINICSGLTTRTALLNNTSFKTALFFLTLMDLQMYVSMSPSRQIQWEYKERCDHIFGACLFELKNTATESFNYFERLHIAGYLLNLLMHVFWHVRSSWLCVCFNVSVYSIVYNNLFVVFMGLQRSSCFTFLRLSYHFAASFRLIILYK